MFKFLAKSAVFSLVWTRYRKIIVSTVVLFGSYFIILLMHRDYLEYAKHSQIDDNIALSYILKWAALLMISSMYYWINIRKNLGKSEQKTSGNQYKNKAKTVGAAQPQPSLTATASIDPFAKIREKDKLSSKCDRILKE